MLLLGPLALQNIRFYLTEEKITTFWKFPGGFLDKIGVKLFENGNMIEVSAIIFVSLKKIKKL